MPDFCKKVIVLVPSLTELTAKAYDDPIAEIANVR
jgi:hypothetical protein